MMMRWLLVAVVGVLAATAAAQDTPSDEQTSSPGQTRFGNAGGGQGGQDVNTRFLSLGQLANAGQTLVNSFLGNNRPNRPGFGGGFGNRPGFGGGFGGNQGFGGGFGNRPGFGGGFGGNQGFGGGFGGNQGFGGGFGNRPGFGGGFGGNQGFGGGFGNRPGFGGGFGGNQGFGGFGNKPGRCPPVRPQCPPTRSFSPPSPCRSDRQCSGFDKCCFDTCLGDTVCKPAQ